MLVRPLQQRFNINRLANFLAYPGLLTLAPLDLRGGIDCG